MLFGQINAAKPIPEVFEDVKAIFAPYAKVNFTCFIICLLIAFLHASCNSCMTNSMFIAALQAQ
jgi:hypothetical protein